VRSCLFLPGLNRLLGIGVIPDDRRHHQDPAEPTFPDDPAGSVEARDRWDHDEVGGLPGGLALVAGLGVADLLDRAPPAADLTQEMEEISPTELRVSTGRSNLKVWTFMPAAVRSPISKPP
jgi:hypothetical protein